MAHIFQQYLKEEHQVRQVSVEKNTKKAVKETIAQMEEIFKDRDSRIIIEVDATVLKDKEKITPLVAYSLYHYRNFSEHSMSVPVVQLNSSLFSEEYSEEEYHAYVKLRSRGDSWDSYLEVEDANWISVNACIKHDFYEKLSKLEEVTNRYKSFIEKEKEEKIPFDYHRKWNFTRSSTNLLSLYNRCFNEIARILHPSLQYNPSPSFQRDLVWPLEKKQLFIQSILQEIPIGSFYINMGEVYDPYNELGEGFGGLVWDGKQRLHALHSFILGEYDVEVNGERVTYFDNPGYFNYRFDNCAITVFESRFDDLKDIIHAYVTINKSQVKHTDEDLQKAIDYLESKSKGY